MTWLPTNCTRRQNGDADAACDQRIFDGRGAVFILHEAAHRAYVRLLHVETIQFRQFSHNSAIKCEIRGTSAGGISYSRNLFGLTQESFCPSSAVTIPSQRRQT